VRVLAAVRARLRSSGVTLDPSDLDACYASAWQGLYMATLEGEEIESTASWLVLVTFRRAIEEHRARGRVQRLREQMQADTVCGSGTSAGGPCAERDLAAELDDRMQLRQLLEGLRGRLSAREREAAVLCYLQGFSRAQAAERMGVSEKRMRKLMEGAGAGRSGVAGKVGALVDTIRAGQWCDEQGSLMRALAYGVLDPNGERYKLAIAHRSECPACRVYVLSLRGLAATLPPVLLPWGLGAAALMRDGVHVGAVGPARAGAGSGALSGGAAGTGAGVGAAGGGAAGGGWLFAGGAKLAAGCVLALGVGAGCAAFEVGAPHRSAPARTHRRLARASGVGGHAQPLTQIPAQLGAVSHGQPPTETGAAVTASLTPAARASREFGPEQGLAGAAHSQAGAPRAVAARNASSTAASVPSVEASGPATTETARASASASASAPAGSASAAEREFSPG